MAMKDVQARMNRTRRALKLKYDINLPKQYDDQAVDVAPRKDEEKFEKVRRYIEQIKHKNKESGKAWWDALAQDRELQDKVKRYLEDLDWYYLQNREAIRRAFIRQRFSKGQPISAYCTELVTLDQYDRTFADIIRFVRKNEQRQFLMRFRGKKEDDDETPPLPIEFVIRLEKGRELVSRYRIGDPRPKVEEEQTDLAEDERPVLEDDDYLKFIFD